MLSVVEVTGAAAVSSSVRRWLVRIAEAIAIAEVPVEGWRGWAAVWALVGIGRVNGGSSSSLPARILLAMSSSREDITRCGSKLPSGAKEEALGLAVRRLRGAEGRAEVAMLGGMTTRDPA